MNLRLALVLEVQPSSCTVRYPEDETPLLAHYSPPVHNRIKIRPGQLVALDAASSPPEVLWRWFRGRVVYRQEDHVVLDNHIYQRGFRYPISVARLPDELEVDVNVGDDVFYSFGQDAVVIDTVEADGPAHPQRIAADLFPALAETYAEILEQEGL